VVKALIVAYHERPSRNELARKSDTEAPIGIIDRLRSKDKNWDSVPTKPSVPHGGYGIRLEDLTD